MISIEQYNAIIDLIYSSAIDADLWQTTLLAIQNAVSGCGALLGIDIIGRPGLFAVSGYDTEAMESFATTYASKSYVWSLLPLAQEGSPIHDRRVLPPDRRRRDVFANEWATRYDTTDCIVLPLLKRDSATAFAVFGRSPGCGPFENDAQDLISRLLPHLQRAARIRIELDRAELDAALGVEAMEKLRDGIVFVTHDAMVTYANVAARQLLAGDGGGLKTRGPQLLAREIDVNVALQRLIGRAGGMAGEAPIGGVLMIETEDRLRPLTVFCVPLSRRRLWLTEQQSVAMLVISDASPRFLQSDATLAAFFGLTPAETRLASHLAGGATLAEAAEDLGVARTTVSTHLRAIFSKTRTNRQAELVRLLNALPAVRNN